MAAGDGAALRCFESPLREAFSVCGAPSLRETLSLLGGPVRERPAEAKENPPEKTSSGSMRG